MVLCLLMPFFRRQFIPATEVFKVYNWKALAILSSLGITADLCAIVSFRSNSLGQVYVLLLSIPLFSAMIDLILFKRKLSRLKTMALILGFMATALMANPSLNFSLDDPFSLLLALVAAFLYSVLFFVLKFYAKRESVFVLFVNSQSIPILLLVFPVLYAWQSMTAEHLLISFVSGIGFFIGTFFLLHATKFGRIVIISTLQFSQIPMALVFDLLLYAIVPSPITLLCAALIILSCFVMIKKTAG